MKTVAEILSDAALLAEYTKEYSAFVGNSAQEARKLLMYLRHEGEKLVQEHEWPVLVREHVITLVQGQDTYPLPADYDRQLEGTHFNRTDQRAVFYGTTADQWQRLKASSSTDLVVQRLRVFGWTDNQIHIYNNPTSNDAGQEVVFEYVSNAWIRPRAWTTGVNVIAGDRVWHNGNVYTADSTGALGATAPTHTSGSVSDGSIGLTYLQNYGQSSVLKDTDVPLFDDLLLTLGVTIRALRQDSLNIDRYTTEYGLRLERVKTNLSSAPKLNAFCKGTEYPYTAPALPEVWG